MSPTSYQAALPRVEDLLEVPTDDPVAQVWRLAPTSEV